MTSTPEKTSVWGYQDEVEYEHLKQRYGDRQTLVDEMVNKRKAFQKIDPADPLYHRLAVSAEMARLRADMAYIVGENAKLKEYIGTMSWLHDQIGVLQGAYAHVKMVADQSQTDYKLVTKAIAEMLKLKREMTSGAEQRSDRPDGQKGEVLPDEGE